MVTRDAYLADPCGTLSIPYWKHRQTAVPPEIRILHERDWSLEAGAGYRDTRYFRLMHPLTGVVRTAVPGYTLRTAGEEDVPLMAEVIDRCYTDMAVTPRYLAGLRDSAVFCPELWVIVKDGDDRAAGCGIAEVDRELGEGALEWIQVLPEYRRQGLGGMIVNELLARMTDLAGFATVSGRLDDPSCPLRLYRRCGFQGEDVWHILVR